MPLKVLFLNCTLKRSPQVSNTRALIDKAVSLYGELDIESEIVRVVDHNVMFGVSSNEGPDDEWPVILEKIKTCDILIIASPIWFGVRSAVAQLVIERLDGTYEESNPETGQFPLYGKVGGVLVTGNEDGAHNVAAHTLFNLTHLGCTIPPNVDSYWVGPAGPGPSYLEAGGERHLYTNKTVRYMVHNTAFFAKLLKENPIPINLNQLIEEAKKESD
ncbi:multimeric flavodoxin WrbA [Methanohalophilus levihalophilus]|uniref:flavodoxin family protein n=1 Tax=Methanohalophilus levihalophilus TaxID=1431282 RepID=UPI001AE96AAF|nr:flavodoxin family protein [Methanohalophilus levihalophilus]MBP2029567.1 multimeric flavodoxin WrbA [Methanohalophilus levihalophilus]